MKTKDLEADAEEKDGSRYGWWIRSWTLDYAYQMGDSVFVNDEHFQGPYVTEAMAKVMAWLDRTFHVVRYPRFQTYHQQIFEGFRPRTTLWNAQVAKDSDSVYVRGLNLKGKQ